MLIFSRKTKWLLGTTHFRKHPYAFPNTQWGLPLFTHNLEMKVLKEKERIDSPRLNGMMYVSHRSQMAFMFDGQFSKTRPFPSKTRIIWVLGIHLGSLEDKSVNLYVNQPHWVSGIKTSRKTNFLLLAYINRKETAKLKNWAGSVLGGLHPRIQMTPYFWKISFQNC